MGSYILEDAPGYNKLDGIWTGEFAEDVTNVNDPAYVFLESFSHEHKIGPCRWQTRGGALPEKGMDCLVGYDENETPYVIVWWDGTSGLIIPDNSITSAKIVDGTIDTVDLKDASVTTPKLAVTPEPWHTVGAPGEPAFQNSWTNFAVGSWEVAAFYKDPFERVHLKGLINNGTMGQIAFTLPAGYRPQYNLLWGTDTGTGHGRLDVEPSGAVRPNAGSNTYFGINVSFRAA